MYITYSTLHHLTLVGGLYLSIQRSGETFDAECRDSGLPRSSAAFLLESNGSMDGGHGGRITSMVAALQCQ